MVMNDKVMRCTAEEASGQNPNKIITTKKIYPLGNLVLNLFRNFGDIVA